MIPKTGPPRDQFLMADRDSIRKIVSLAGILPGESVLEIGAGTGLLTRELAKRARVIAVEKDRGFRKELGKLPGNVRVIYGNILDKVDSLRFDRIVSNIPYAISEPLLRRLPRKEFRSAVLVVPRNFALRLVAGQGDRAYSGLSLFAQAFFLAELCFEVPRDSFLPRPGTRSVVIRLTPREESLMGGVLLRRKSKARNALLRVLTGGKDSGKMTKREARKVINTLSINKVLDKRVRDLSLDELKIIGRKMEKHTKTVTSRTC